MSQANIITIVFAFAVYLIAMIGVGVWSMSKTNNTEDYFLGGRGLGSWVAALSAQASDMSGWLLMGLPGSIYALGTGQIWIAVGLFIGTAANWLLISKRLRRYTIVANNALTLPEYFEHRFQDKKKILLTISSVVIVIFFLVYTASALASGGKLFNTVFNIDYHIALLIGVTVILVYTFMGGFLAVCTTDLIQGLMMLIGLMTVPVFAYAFISGDFTQLLAKSNEAAAYAGTTADYLNPFSNGGEPYRVIDILSKLAWGLGYCGMPHVLVRFMAVRSEKELKKSSAIAITWCFISLTAACLIGILGRAYLFPTVLGTNGNASAESVFIVMIDKVFTENLALPFLAGIFLCGILAAIMSTADSQLLVCASSVSKDIYKDLIKPDADDNKVLYVSRMTVIGVAAIAFLIAWNPNSSIMALVSDAWAGLGSAFGPIVVCSLFWKRTNLPGAIAGIVSGGVTVLVWDYFPLVHGQTLGTATGIYSLLVGFVISLVLIVIVSLCTKKPSQQMLDDFEKVNNYTEQDLK